MQKLSSLLILISFSIILIFSCQKDKPSVAPVDSGSSNTLKTTVTGIVLDESNAPLNGVTVTAYGQSTSTDQHGVFVLKNINADKNRCVLQFSKSGFFKRSHGLIASANTVNYVRIILLSNAATQNFSSSAGGTISLPDGSSAAFQPNSFVSTNGSAYTGTVNLIVKHLSPDDTNFGFMIPGGDLLGTDLNNKDVALYTYGMLGVELTGSSGESLQLASGTSATLTFAIAVSQLTNAPASIPLWYFDETTSLWKEEGSANKIGNNYVGTVNHFSWWNCDIGTESPLIKGKVIDCNGTAVPNCIVTVNGWATTLTNQNGEWQGQVPSGIALTVQVLMSNNPWLTQDSQLENIPALSNTQIFIVPDLIIPCPTRVAGVIKTCSGTTTDGIIFLTNNAGFYTYQYVEEGIFNLISIENSQLELNAYNTNGSNIQNITTLTAPNVLNVGNILLCDSFSLFGNFFTVVSNGFPSQTFIISLINHSANTDSIGQVGTHISITGTAFPSYTISYCDINIQDTVPTSTFCDLVITMTDTAGNYYSINGSNLSCDLEQVGGVGGKIKGNYYGVVTTMSSTTSTGTISGNFDVLRTP
jgi:carboxypeptidase family protein